MKKKIISLALAILMFCAASVPVYADGLGVRTVIGADLTPEQKTEVYNNFGIPQGSVKEITMTNAMEHAALDGCVDPGIIGSHSISCVYVNLKNDGSGMNITTSNISWCTAEMYISALATAGITDADIIVTAPFAVSGTAALAGVFLAYEDITGLKLDDLAKTVATQQLTVTGDLANYLSDPNLANDIVGDLKDLLDETENMSDEQITSEIREIAGMYGVSLTDKQVNQLLELCKSLQGLDEDQLAAKVRDVQGTLNKVSNAQTKIVGFVSGVKKVVTSVTSFFDKISGILNRHGA